MGKAITEIGTYAGPISATTKIPVSDGDTLQAATAAQLVDYNTAATHSATSKATPVDADELPLVDSAASNVLKKLTWANLKATLKTYLDTLYQATLVSGTNIKTINSTSLLGSGDLTVSASPGGSTTQVQFNDAGAFAGDVGLTFNKTTKKLAAGGNLDLTGGNGTIINTGVGSLSLVSSSAGYMFGYDRQLTLGGGGGAGGAYSITVGLRFSDANAFDFNIVGATAWGLSTNRDGGAIFIAGGAPSGTGKKGSVNASRLNAAGFATAIAAKTANYTATADDGSIEVDATSGAVTITLPAVSGCAGRIYTIKKTDASGNAVTVDPNASETIDGATTASLASQYSTITIQANAAGTAWHKVSGV